MENTSGLWPAGHRILIKTKKIEEKTESGIIVATLSQLDREQLSVHSGVVVAIGHSAYADQPTPWCKVGDEVTFGKYSGLVYKGEETKDGNEYRMINDLDVVAIHEKKESE